MDNIEIGQDVYVVCKHIVSDDNKLIDEVVGVYSTKEKAVKAQELHLFNGYMTSIKELKLA